MTKQAPAAVLLVCLVAIGCSSPRPRKPTHPVSGRVYWVDVNQPAVNAFVVFRPLNDADPKAWPDGFPRGTVGIDGSFKLSTFEDNDGAPAGKYAVLITWYTTSAATEEEAAVDRLGGRFNQVNQPRWTRTVVAGDNDPKKFNFVLR